MIKHKTIADLLYLCICALHEAEPEEEIVKEMDLPVLRGVAELHKLGALAGMGLRKLSPDPGAVFGEKEWSAWKELIDKSIRRTMLFDTERAEICTWFEDQKIWYLPLKGILIKDMYPEYGMREFADNDILVDAKRMLDVKKFMTGRGYKYEHSKNSAHDSYLKEPFYNFEIHHCLFTESIMQSISGKYYENVYERLHLQNGSYEMSFSDDDCYVYILCHDYKHYQISGTGLRTVVDAYILDQFYKNRDQEYCAAELKKNEADHFEKELIKLASDLFETVHYPDIQKLSEDQRTMLLYMANSGAYGTIAQRIQNQMQKMTGDDKGNKAKLKYLWKRIFPDFEFMAGIYKSLRRHPWMLPFFYIIRLADRTLTAPKKWIRELKTLKKL